MTFPERINAQWIDSLSDVDLVTAESELRESFAEQEAKEKKLRGAKYSLPRGSEALTSAWLRWSMVSNATRARGLRVRYRS